MKVLFGLLLLPFCVAATETLVEVLKAIQPSSLAAVPTSAWWLAGGFVFWLFLFVSLPKPVRTYVFAHELTHALWAWLMGARVSRLRVSSRGGSVAVSKTNFFITLAPYFFPFYTVCAIGLYYVLSMFWDLRTYEPFWLGVIGLTWGFHLTFTVKTLAVHQPDIQEGGRLFSYAVIYLFNVLGICLWIVIVARPTLQGLVELLGQNISLVWAWCGARAVEGYGWVISTIQKARA